MVQILPAHAQRLHVSLNDGWQFQYLGYITDWLAVSPEADSNWQRIDLPHTWNTEDAFDEDGEYRRGQGLYSKELVLDESLRGQKLYLYFEGANQVAQVVVNGELLGEHIGGYTAFAFDITDAVRFDALNTLFVIVDNRHDPDIPPLNADFTFYGGIYRDVWLVATDPIHVDVLDHASPGVFISTPQASAQAATVRVRTRVLNESAQAEDVEVQHVVRDAAGNVVTTITEQQRITAGASAPFDKTSDTISNPHLWSPDDPYLYEVVTEVRVNGEIRDRVVNPLGIRWFSSDANGFTFNGQALRLYGTNRHQDWPVLGNALPNEAHVRDVQLVKDTGFNFLRLAHYPQDPVVLQETDRQGLIVWEEIPVVNLITQSEAFAENAERMLVEMIRQHYNHPSVLFWGYMNEVLLVKPQPTIPDGYYEDVVALAQRLDDVSKREDPTRPTVTAISHGEIDNGTGYEAIADIIGLNLYFGWYYEILEGFGPFLDRLHAQHPERAYMISEYGAGSDERIHSRAAAAVAFDFSTEYQQRFHTESFRQLRERPYILATGVWNQFDFGSNHRQDSKPALNQKGLFYFDRTPKDIFYYYQAELREAPVLHIAARDYAFRAGSRPEDRTHTVHVYTNQPEVELWHEGVSLGKRVPVNSTAQWDVTLTDGENDFVAKGGDVSDTFTIRYEDRTDFFTPGGATSLLAVNAGGAFEVTDEYGVVWETDRAYEENSWGYVGGETKLTHHRIPGGSEPRYQVTRDGAFAYRFDVPEGRYDIALGFVEIMHDTPQARIFDVLVNGQNVIAGLDLAATAGRWNAVEKSVQVEAHDGQGLVLSFVPITGTATVSSILIRRY